MRILQINKFFYRRGGSESYFFDLMDLLEKNGHEIIHFSSKHKKNLESPYRDFFVDEIDFEGRDGLGKDFLKFGHSLYSCEARHKLSNLILKTKPDIAHLHNVSHHLTPSIFSVFRKHRIPVVQTLHDYQLICPNFKLFTEGAVCERCKKYRYWNAVVHSCIHDSRLQSSAECLEMYFHKACQFYEKGVYSFVTPSKFLETKLGEWGIAGRAKIMCIPHFIDAERFNPKYEPGNYAIYFGRLVREKGINVLLEALAGTDMKLKVVGDGPGKEGLRLLSSRLQIDVEFAGYKNGEDLHNMIRDSKFVVLPSVWHENYPMSLIEAGALGKAMIGSRLGGIPEIIENGENGWLAAPGDANDWREKMMSLWNDSGLCERMGRRAREIILKKNSPGEHYRKIIELYKKLTTNN